MSQDLTMIAMVDAAMVEMANIHPPLKRSECERLIRAALARTHQPESAPLADHTDHVSEIAARLRLVANLAGVPDAVPADDGRAVGCIFSVLGNMRLAMERKAQQPAQVVPEALNALADWVDGNGITGISADDDEIVADWLRKCAASQHGERAAIDLARGAGEV